MCRVIWLLLCAFLSACHTAPQPSLPPLLAPALLGRDLQVSQQLLLQVDGEKRNLLVVWSQQQGRFQLLALSAQSQKLFTLTFDGDQLHVQRHLPLAIDFSAERLIRELQWAYWPAEHIVKALAPAGWQLVQEPGARIVVGPRGERVEYRFRDSQFPASLVLTHQQGYRMHIETLTSQALSHAVPTGRPL